MNQTAAATSSSSSSSAAAVADSANAAATTKTAANTVTASVTAAASNAANNVGSAAAATTTTTTTTTAKTTSVKLLIKASNQQFDDQIIESDLLWTVKRLKSHLALVYPNKPPVDEQKLIYSGQLLNDALLLKDVIRSYKDVYTQNHIFHLVYTPKNTLNATNFLQKTKTTNAATTIGANMNPNGISSSVDGLRQRHVAGTTTAANGGQQQQSQYYQQYQQQQHSYAQPQFNAQMGQCPPYDPNNPLQAFPFGMPGHVNMQAVATQQAAMYNWIQQVYSQYMEQCIRMSNNAAGVVTAPSVAVPSLGNNVLPLNPFLQQMPCVAPPLVGATSVAAAGATNPVIPFPSATATAATLLTPSQTAQVNVAQAQMQPVANLGSTSSSAIVADEPPQEQNQQQQLDQERPQVAAPRFPNIVQEEQENRDWLDSFFSITRLAVFLTILYFNSSPLRCLAVVIIAGGIYLYHIGVLRFRHERNNNNLNRNNNEADQIRRGVRQVQQAAQAAEQQQENIDTAEQAVERASTAADNVAIVEGAAATAPATAAAAAAATAATPASTATATTAPAADGTDENTNNTNDNNTSVISVLRTFVVTFFTSLLPETPTL